MSVPTVVGATSCTRGYCFFTLQGRTWGCGGEDERTPSSMPPASSPQISGRCAHASPRPSPHFPKHSPSPQLSTIPPKINMHLLHLPRYYLTLSQFNCFYVRSGYLFVQFFIFHRFVFQYRHNRHFFCCIQIYSRCRGPVGVDIEILLRNTRMCRLSA